MGIVHCEQMLVGNFSGVLRQGFELCLNDVGSFSQHFDIALLLQGENGEQPVSSLFVEVSPKLTSR